MHNKHMRLSFKNRHSGFTLVEIVIVVVVIGILAALTINYIAGAPERAYEARAKAELETIGNAAKLYANKNDEYPADTGRDIPAAIKEFIAKTSQGTDWPDAPWPGSTYDYDAWNIEDDPDDTTDTVQISIRFCEAGQPSTCKFPKEPWATGFGVNSAFYYCVKGYCRPHESESVTYPGYCYNCPNHAAVKKPGE